MISLAGRDILHAWGKFVFTGVGLGLLIGVTLTMAGVYRGMVDDAKVLLDNSGADLWVVQQDTLGPYAESSSIYDDTYRGILGMSGVARAANVTYLTMQVRQLGDGRRAMCARWWLASRPMVPGIPGSRAISWTGATSPAATTRPWPTSPPGLRSVTAFSIRRNEYTVVGLTRRMVSSGGDPMVFIPLKDAQEAQFLKDNDAIVRQRARTAAESGAEPSRRSRSARCRDRLAEHQPLCQRRAGADRTRVRIRNRWLSRSAAGSGSTVYTRAQMQEILIAKLIATSARQIGMFLVILAIVSAAIVAFIIYTLTLGKIREIAVLKLIGTSNRTIAAMILQQAVGLGLIGFVVGKIAATFWAPIFPKYVLLEPGDALRGFVAVMVICVLASIVAIRAALKVDPAEAIGG